MQSERLTTRSVIPNKILASLKRRSIMYYRVAIRQNTSTTWQWKSTTISSLTSLFQFLRRYDKLAQHRLRVFSSPCIEEMDEQLARENNGFGSCSVTAAQLR